jgi:N-acetyltransferase
MPTESFRVPLTLEGRFVRLVPLDRSHRLALRDAADDPEVYRYLVNGPGSTLAELDALLDFVFARQAEGTDLAFTSVSVAEDRPVGMTRYLHIDRVNNAVEIGGTWLGRRWWQTPLNTEAKYLMMRHAFEVEGVHRVYLQTDLRNERAQRSIERLGTVREAVLREDRRLRDGYYRSSVFYSALEEEWPRIREQLERKLARPWPAEGVR